MCTRFVEVRKQDRRSVAVRLQIKVDHRGSIIILTIELTIILTIIIC